MIEISDDTYNPYDLFLMRLYSLREYAENGIIPFPVVWSTICTSFSMSKAKCVRNLIDLHRSGQIKIIRGHGIKLFPIDPAAKYVETSVRYYSVYPTKETLTKLRRKENAEFKDWADRTIKMLNKRKKKKS